MKYFDELTPGRDEGAGDDWQKILASLPPITPRKKEDGPQDGAEKPEIASVLHAIPQTEVDAAEASLSQSEDEAAIPPPSQMEKGLLQIEESEPSEQSAPEAATGTKQSREEVEEKIASWGDKFPGPVIFRQETPVSRMAQEIARVEGVPLELATMACWGAVSVACGAGIEVKGMKKRRSRPNLYLWLSAESGIGKSVTFDHAFRPLFALEKEFLDEWDCQTKASLISRTEIAEEKKKLLKAEIKKNPANLHGIGNELKAINAEILSLSKQLHSPKLISEDATVEALGRQLGWSGEVLAMVSADGRSLVKNLLGKYNPNKSADDELYVKGWSGDPHKLDRIGREGGNLLRPCLSMCVAVQPDKTGKVFGLDSLEDSGFLARLLVAEIPEPSEIPDDDDALEMDPKVVQDYNSFLRSVAEHFRIRFLKGQCVAEEIEIPEADRKLLREWAREWQVWARGPLHDMAVYVRRWAENLLRNALVQHVILHGTAAGGRELDSRALMHAWLNQKWFAAKQLRLLNCGRAARRKEEKAKLLDILNGSPNLEVTQSYLGEHGWDKERVQRVVADNREELEIETLPSGQQGGRPPTVVRYKPLIR